MIKFNQHKSIGYYFHNYFHYKSFKYSDIWYEYYSSEELSFFKETGFTEREIETIIYPQFDLEKEMYYYSIDKVLKDREFIFIKCNVLFDNIAKLGYITLVNQQKTSLVVILSENESIPFYTSVMETYDENITNRDRLLKALDFKSTFSKFKLTFDKGIRSIFDLQNEFEI